MTGHEAADWLEANLTGQGAGMPPKWRVGYHYTAEKNWFQICKEGLHPTPLKEAYTQLGVLTGVWVWTHRLRGLSHAGSLIFQAADKATPRIVLLEVRYRPNEIVRTSDGEFPRSTHDGSVGNLVYHHDEPSVVLANAVPPERVRLIETYDLVEMLANGRR